MEGNANRSEARRLVLLYRLRMAGVLENLTLRQIGKILGVSRATLLLDLHDLDEADDEFRRLMEAQPWRQWAAGSIEEKESDEQIEAIKRLMRDGLVWLRNWVDPREARSEVGDVCEEAQGTRPPATVLNPFSPRGRSA